MTTIFGLAAALIMALVYFADPASVDGTGQGLNFGSPLTTVTVPNSGSDPGPDAKS